MYSEDKYNLPLIEGAVHVHGGYICQNLIISKQLYDRLYLHRDTYILYLAHFSPLLSPQCCTIIICTFYIV